MSTSTRRKLPSRMTVDEFIDWAADDSRPPWQLVDGEPRATAPTSATHGAIQTNLAYLLTRRLIESGSACRAVTEPAIVPRVRASSNLRVADLAITCSPIEPGQIVLSDPVLIVEILSPTNELDTWKNVWAYVSMPSVLEILVVRSTSVAADLLPRRPDGAWPEEPTKLGPNDLLHLDSIDLTCPLADVYARTDLARSA
jgi:Uma2 family endonuclease